MPYSKLYILTELSATDVKFISVDRQKLELSKYIYLYIVISKFVEIQPDSTNIENDPQIVQDFWSGVPIEKIFCNVMIHE